MYVIYSYTCGMPREHGCMGSDNTIDIVGTYSDRKSAEQKLEDLQEEKINFHSLQHKCENCPINSYQYIGKYSEAERSDLAKKQCANFDEQRIKILKDKTRLGCGNYKNENSFANKYPDEYRLFDTENLIDLYTILRQR